MKNTQRLLILALTVVLALGGLSGISFARASDLEPVELIYWIGGDGEQTDSAEVYALLNEKLTEKMNTTIKWVNIPFGEYYEKWSKAMAAQEQIDICWTGWMINIETEVSNGALLPLDDYAEYAPNLFASLRPEAIDIHRSSDGMLYQFPAWQGLVGKRSYFAYPADKAALIGDDTWLSTLQELLYANWDKTAQEKTAVYDHVEKYLAALKENDALEYGYPAGVNDLSGWYMPKGTFEFSVGANVYAYVDYYDDTFTVKPSVESDRYKLNAQYMADWFQKGYIRQDIASLEVNKLVIDWTGTSTEDIYIMNGHNAFTDNSLSKELAGAGFETVAVFTNPYTVFGNGSATGTSIPFTSKNPERAMMFADLLVTEEGKEIYNIFNYGIEGKHYEWNDDETITVFGGNSQAGVDWAYGGRPWTLGSLMFAYSCPAYPAPYYEELKEAEETAYIEPLTPFKFNVTNVEIEAANLKAIFEEYDPMFKRGYLGADWEAKYDEFIDKMYAGGYETYLAELQQQVNEYVEANGSKW